MLVALMIVVDVLLVVTLVLFLRFRRHKSRPLRIAVLVSSALLVAAAVVLIVLALQ